MITVAVIAVIYWTAVLITKVIEKKRIPKPIKLEGRFK